jgi:hypothetical protein
LKGVDRQTAVILESIFGGICALFMILWLIYAVVPAFTAIINEADIGTAFISMFWNIYFIWMLIFLIPASIFNEIKKNIDKRPIQKVVYVPQQQQQQQQQQVIQVNVPPPPPPVQYYATTPSPPPQPRPPSIPPTDTVFCIACGSPNRKDARFCKVCGATID